MYVALLSNQSISLTSSEQGKHQFLGPKSSSTYNQTDTIWAIRYGSGAVLGHLVYDRFEVAGLVLKKFFFGVARNETIQFTP